MQRDHDKLLRRPFFFPLVLPERLFNALVAAAAWFRRSVPGTSGSVRAGLLVGEARSLRRAGNTDEALTALKELSSTDDATVAGVPAGLFARWATCDLLESAG